jgi:hypothetical protein
MLSPLWNGDKPRSLENHCNSKQISDFSIFKVKNELKEE